MKRSGTGTKRSAPIMAKKKAGRSASRVVKMSKRAPVLRSKPTILYPLSGSPLA